MKVRELYGFERVSYIMGSAQVVRPNSDVCLLTSDFHDPNISLI